MKFEVRENETITECLARMKAAGYMPVKRFQKPIFIENEKGEIEVFKEQIIFTGKKITE
ncbi:NETI motif-containing protein [Macrococcoides caseolyticum]|uniref:NETI motif-containing protein n=1 Tax=Macrococcoides caseolyticum TaxID=69966 RepID=UPI001F481563|nr:NETI motif-containing protein [Macrococcus caseolyticus]MCE4957460.1 NETI motif-containing protein [Macrococcus caseolyticus]